MMRWIFAMVFVGMVGAGVMPRTVAAATTAQVNEAVTNGIAWLLAEQTNTAGSAGSFGSSTYGDGWYAANTGFAVAVLEHHAEKLNKTPLGATYANAAAVQAGLNYLFSSATTDGSTYVYWAVNPDTVYQSGMPLMAIARSGAPNAVVNVAGCALNGKTYKQVAQMATNWLATQQSSTYGGWSYSGPGDDQSTNGWVAMGIGYAVHSMGCTMPANVITYLKIANAGVQNTTVGSQMFGGAAYSSDKVTYVNTYKTGHLIYDLGLTEPNIANGHVSGNTTYTAVENALTYLNYHWNEVGSVCYSGGTGGWRGTGTASAFNAMFSTSKGLNEYKITSFGSVTNWYDDFATVIYNNKITDGAATPKWHWLGGGCLGDNIAIRATSSALLTLLKATSDPLPGSLVTAPANGRYGLNQNLDFTATFTEAVTVSGTPRLQLNIGGVTQYANYLSGSGTAILTFRYTTQASDNDLDGITVLSPIGKNSGTIKDTSNTPPLEVTYTNSIPDTTAVLVDNTPPTVSSNSVSAANRLESNTVTLSYTFSEPVSGVTASNFTLASSNLSGTVNGAPACSSGSPPCPTWNVVVSNVGTVSSGISGTLHLDLANGNNIVDSANPTNAMIGASTSTGTTVTVWKPITIPTILPTGVLTVPYNNTVAATGGSGTYATYAKSGNIPGLSLAANGTFSGTPTTAGSYSITITATDSNGMIGSQDYLILVVNTHTVTTAITNGTITPSSIAVTHGLTTTLSVAANTGYHITGVTASANCAATYTPAAYTNGTGGIASYSFTTGAVNNDCTVTATTAINKYDITVTPDAHSNISGYALNTPHTYSNDYNASQAVTITADTANGYHLTGITNNCGGTASATYRNAVNETWIKTADFTPSGTAGQVTAGVVPNCSVSATSAINVYSITPTVSIVGP